MDEDDVKEEVNDVKANEEGAAAVEEIQGRYWPVNDAAMDESVSFEEDTASAPASSSSIYMVILTWSGVRFSTIRPYIFLHGRRKWGWKIGT